MKVYRRIMALSLAAVVAVSGIAGTKCRRSKQHRRGSGAERGGHGSCLVG